MVAVATDWLVDSASDVKEFRHTPYQRVVRVRLVSGAVYATGPGLGIPAPANDRLGVRKAPDYINVLNNVARSTTATTVLDGVIWSWDNSLRTLFAHKLSTASITAQDIVEVTSGEDIGGTVLYLEVHGH